MCAVVLIQFLFLCCSLPEWAEKIMVPGGDFELLSEFWYQLHTTTTEMKRLKSGFLVKEILDRFRNKTQSTLSPDRSLWMYFAHDYTIINALNSLGLYQVLLIFALELNVKHLFEITFYRCSHTLPHMRRAFYLSYMKRKTPPTYK